MSQNDVDFSSDPSGDTLLDTLLTGLQQNVLTNNAGTSRPSYAVAHTTWTDTTTTPWVVYYFDGADDIAIGTINATTNKFVPNGFATTDSVTFDDLTITDTIKTSGGLVGLNGRTSPECALDLLVNVDSNRAVQLYNSDDTLSDGETVSRILFKQNDNSNPNTVHAAVDAVAAGTAGSLSLSFKTGSSGTIAERFKLSPSGVTTFPSILTTASAANAFLDSGASNSLLRSTSSARYKRDIEDLSPDFSEKIYSMRPVWYRSKAQADRQDWSYFGLIAEEMHEIEPRLVHYTYQPEDYEANKDGDPVLKEGATPIPDGIQYERLTVLLLAEVKKLNERIKELESSL